jgi:hypothetical protein
MKPVSPKKSDIEAIEKSMRTMLEKQGLDAMISEFAKALAYQNALNAITIEIYKDIIKEMKKSVSK